MAKEVCQWQTTKVVEFIKGIPELSKYAVHFSRLGIDGEKLMNIKNVKDCNGIHGITKSDVFVLTTNIRKTIELPDDNTQDTCENGRSVSTNLKKNGVDSKNNETSSHIGLVQSEIPDSSILSSPKLTGSFKLCRKPVIRQKPVLRPKPRIQSRLAVGNVLVPTKPAIQPKPSVQEIQQRIKALTNKIPENSKPCKDDHVRENLTVEIDKNRGVAGREINPEEESSCLKHSYSADDLDNYRDSPSNDHSLSSDNSSVYNQSQGKETVVGEQVVAQDHQLAGETKRPDCIVINGQVYSRVNRKIKLRKLKRKHKRKDIDADESDKNGSSLGDRTLSESNLSKLSKQLKRPFSSIILGKQNKRASIGSVFAEPFLRLANRKKPIQHQVSEFDDDEDPYDFAGFEEGEFSDDGDDGDTLPVNGENMDDGDDYEEPQADVFPPHREKQIFEGRKPPPLPVMKGRRPPDVPIGQRPPPPLPREAARPPAPTPIGQVDNDDEGDEEEYLEPSERPSQPTPFPRETGRPPAPPPIPQVDHDVDEEEYVEPTERPEVPPPKPNPPHRSPEQPRSALFSKQIQEHHLIKKDRLKLPEPEPISDEYYEEPQQRQPPSQFASSVHRPPPPTPKSIQPKLNRPPPPIPGTKKQQQEEEEEFENEEEYNEIPAQQVTEGRTAGRPPPPIPPKMEDEEEEGIMEEEYNEIPADNLKTPTKPWRFNKHAMQAKANKEKQPPVLPPQRKAVPLPSLQQDEDTYEATPDEQERISGGSNIVNQGRGALPTPNHRANAPSRGTKSTPQGVQQPSVNTLILKDALKKQRPALTAVKKEQGDGDSDTTESPLSSPVAPRKARGVPKVPKVTLTPVSSPIPARRNLNTLDKRELPQTPPPIPSSPRLWNQRVASPSPPPPVPPPLRGAANSPQNAPSQDDEDSYYLGLDSADATTDYTLEQSVQDENKNPLTGGVKDQARALNLKFGKAGFLSPQNNAPSPPQRPSHSEDEASGSSGRESNISLGSTSSDSGDGRVIKVPPVPRKHPDIVGDMQNRPPPPIPASQKEPVKKTLEQQEWFFDTADRNLVKSRLQSFTQNGVFLVRRSNQKDQPYTLAVTYNRQIKNIPICRRSHNSIKPFALGTPKEGEETFASVEDLVTYHRTNDIIVAGEVNATVKLLKSPP